jgi:hypothetical protein
MLALGPAEGVHVEALLAAAYALLLLAIAFGIERLAHRTHGRAQSYETRGFTYHPHLDVWQCPAGAHLLQIAVEYERRLARYRAPAASCNACPLKAGCTDSDMGRELTRTFDPWLESEIGHFHRGLSLVLVALAGLITTVALLRNRAEPDLLVLIPVSLIIVAVAFRRLRKNTAGTMHAAELSGGERPSW